MLAYIYSSEIDELLFHMLSCFNAKVMCFLVCHLSFCVACIFLVFFCALRVDSLSDIRARRARAARIARDLYR